MDTAKQLKNPGNIVHYGLFRANCLEQESDRDSAIALIRNEQKQTNTWWKRTADDQTLAILYVRNKRLDAAYTSLHEALQRDPNNVINTLRLAEVCKQMHRYAESGELLRKAKRSDPTTARWLEGYFTYLYSNST
jgi:Tfp pilus assembly protein PilF